MLSPNIKPTACTSSLVASTYLHTSTFPHMRRKQKLFFSDLPYVFVLCSVSKANASSRKGRLLPCHRVPMSLVAGVQMTRQLEASLLHRVWPGVFVSSWFQSILGQVHVMYVCTWMLSDSKLLISRSDGLRRCVQSYSWCDATDVKYVYKWKLSGNNFPFKTGTIAHAPITLM